MEARYIRSPPSSCAELTSKTVGSIGHGWCSGRDVAGCMPIARFVTLSAPWRCAVPMQSAPVSPPPITMTCLPSALIWLGTWSPATALFDSMRYSIAKCTPARSRPGMASSRGIVDPVAITTAS